MKRLLLPVAILACNLTIPDTIASIRIDMPDMPGPQVRKQMIHFGSTEPYTQVTGALLVDRVSLATAIALDRHTIITSAHTHGLADAQFCVFRLDPNALSDQKTSKYEERIINTKAIVHPGFRLQTPEPTTFEVVDDKVLFSGLPIEKVVNYSFAEFNSSDLMKSVSFMGPDLAILKLAEPLPEGLHYPELLDLDEVVQNRYASTIGYGEMFYNDQTRGPIPVTPDPQQRYLRHLISNKVSAYQGNSEHLFYGNYRGLFVNGNESFLPDKAMKKTEALPVGGSSGGPLFMRSKTGDIKLAGILSGSQFLNQNYMSGPFREALSFLVQPIFPIWEDIRFYKAWIQAHMGSPKE